MSAESRVLGAEMTAEGWIVIGGDWIMWLHPPTQRSVCVEGPTRWKICRGIPPYGERPDAEAEGYLVACSHHDEMGNPTEGDCFWIESYGAALRHARRIRQAILDEKLPMPAHEQLGLDALLERK